VDEQHPSVAPERMATWRRPLGLFGATQSHCVTGFPAQACAPEASDWSTFAAAVPAGVPVSSWVLRDFGHMDFVDPGCGFACSACAGGGAPLTTRLLSLRALCVAFLDRTLRDDATAQGYLDGAERTALRDAGVLWNGMVSTLPRCP
jgi:hypothetical protein